MMYNFNSHAAGMASGKDTMIGVAVFFGGTPIVHQDAHFSGSFTSREEIF
jgi:hypothetical protein